MARSERPDAPRGTKAREFDKLRIALFEIVPFIHTDNSTRPFVAPQVWRHVWWTRLFPFNHRRWNYREQNRIADVVDFSICREEPYCKWVSGSGTYRVVRTLAHIQVSLTCTHTHTHAHDTVTIAHILASTSIEEELKCKQTGRRTFIRSATVILL